jgi:mRNA interferase RelE/StbE
MTYSVRISKSASKEIELLPKHKVTRVMSKIEELGFNPRPPGCKKLAGTAEKLWRIRSGNYRIVYSVEDEIKIVEVRSVGDRKNIYK